jgi:hypothetical protein
MLNPIWTMSGEALLNAGRTRRRASSPPERVPTRTSCENRAQRQIADARRIVTGRSCYLCVGGIRAPITQNSGMGIPMRNITQCPLLIDLMPRKMNRRK